MVTVTGKRHHGGYVQRRRCYLGGEDDAVIPKIIITVNKDPRIFRRDYLGQAALGEIGITQMFRALKMLHRVLIRASGIEDDRSGLLCHLQKLLDPHAMALSNLV